MNSKPAFHTYFSASMQLRYGHDKPMINEVCSSLSFFLSFFFGGFVSTNHPAHPGDHFFSNNLLQGVSFRTEGTSRGSIPVYDSGFESIL